MRISEDIARIISGILRLPLFLRPEGNAAEFCQAADQKSHILAEFQLDLFFRGQRVFNRVVQQSADDRGRIHLHIDQDAGDFHGMRQIRLSGQAHLALMHGGRIDISLLNHLQIFGRQIGLRFIQNIIDS